MSAVTFTPAQQSAIDVARRDENACIVAGPGSGKTTVLVEYYRRLVNAGVDPVRILAITFTEKAAGNMRKKLAEAFAADPSLRARLERGWVSTVHGFCARILRENAVSAAVDPRFAIADEGEAWRLQRQSMPAAMEELFRDDPAGVRAFIRGLSSFEFEEAVLCAYDAMRGAGVSVGQVAAMPLPAGADWNELNAMLRALARETVFNWSAPQRQHLGEILEGAERVLTAAGPLERLQAAASFPCNLTRCKRGNAAYELVKRIRDFIEASLYTSITEFYAPERAFLIGILRRFDELYRERKRAAGWLDFADLEEFTVRLMESDAAARDRIRAQFDYILMDEFQDTNGQQARLMNLVRRAGGFYAVGDINQSIFGFRHAEPRGFEDYRAEVERTGGRLVDLAENFRSRAAVLRTVEIVTHPRDGILARPLIPAREFAGERARCVEAASFEEPEHEARWIAARIGEMVSAGEFAFEDMAVLVRNSEVIQAITEAFDAAGVPHIVNRGRGFYDAREVNDLHQLLRAIANPRDGIALAAVLRSPLAAVSGEALLALKLREWNIGDALLRLDAAAAGEFDRADYAKLGRFRDLLRQWRARRDYVSFDRLLLSAIDECGYPYRPGSREAANIDKFLAQARAAAARLSLDAFVSELQQVRDTNPREADAPPEDASDTVKMMTVHSAKGLEFPVVFLAALQKGVETSPPVVAFDPAIGIGARWRNPAVRKDKDDLVESAIRGRRQIREARESDRLLYVAMTRAEERLVLSYSGKPANWAKLVSERLQVTAREAPAEPSPKAAAAAVGGAGFELLPPPAVTGQYDNSAPVTALAAYVHCPRLYYLGGYLRFEGRRHDERNGAGAALSAAQLGTQVHELLAETPVENPDPEALRLAAVFRDGPLGRRLERAARSARECDFLMAVEELVVHGKIDLWFEEGGELTIVDYKTDDVSRREAHQRAREYAVQLRIYAAALEKLAGRAPDRAWLHFLRPDTLVEVDLAPSLLESPAQVVRDFMEAQSTLTFPLNEGAHCHRCRFYGDVCPSRGAPTPAAARSEGTA